jgi:hypothetical protein
MPNMRGIDAVACTLAAGMPRTREIQPPRTRDGASRTRGAQNLNGDLIMVDDDPFVRICVQEKIAVVRFLIEIQIIPLLALRKMTVNHQHVCARESDEKRKSADTLCSEFLVHQCTGACLILRSEANLAGLNLPLLFHPVKFNNACCFLSPENEKLSPCLTVHVKSPVCPLKPQHPVLLSLSYCLRVRRTTSFMSFVQPLAMLR